MLLYVDILERCFHHINGVMGWRVGVMGKEKNVIVIVIV